MVEKLSVPEQKRRERQKFRSTPQGAPGAAAAGSAVRSAIRAIKAAAPPELQVPAGAADVDLPAAPPEIVKPAKAKPATDPPLMMPSRLLSD